MNTWNSLPKSVVSVNTTNTLKTRLDRAKFWHNHDIIYNFGHSCKESEVVASFSTKNLRKLSTSTSPLHVQHFPAIPCNYNGMTAYICRRFIPTIAFLVNILLKENQNCRVIGGLAQPQWYIWPKMDCWCQTRVRTFEGAYFIASAPGCRKPQLCHWDYYKLQLNLRESKVMEIKSKTA